MPQAKTRSKPKAVKLILSEDERLTPRQEEILRFVYDHARDRGWQPSLREIQDRFGVASANGIRMHLVSMARKGWIAPVESHPAGVSRSLIFLRRPDGSPFTGFLDKPSGAET